MPNFVIQYFWQTVTHWLLTNLDSARLVLKIYKDCVIYGKFCAYFYHFQGFFTLSLEFYYNEAIVYFRIDIRKKKLSWLVSIYLNTKNVKNNMEKIFFSFWKIVSRLFCYLVVLTKSLRCMDTSSVWACARTPSSCTWMCGGGQRTVCSALSTLQPLRRR